MLPKLFERVINEGDEKLLKLILEKKLAENGYALTNLHTLVMTFMILK